MQAITPIEVFFSTFKDTWHRDCAVIFFRKYGAEVLDRVCFKNCNEKVQKIVGLVTSYMQDLE